MALKSTAAHNSGKNAAQSRNKTKKIHAWNMKQAGEIDYTFLVIVICVVAVGLVVLLSARYTEAHIISSEGSFCAL